MAKHEADTAELYDRVWRRGTYAGFSRSTAGESSTPFLEAFLREVKALPVSAPRVLELGAGGCDHALRCAREGLHATAVEYSGAAVAAARERALGAGVALEIVQADLFAFTEGLAPSHFAGVYANAVFHFISADQRVGQYRRLGRALVDGGVLAISFKADGDALQRRGSVVEETAAGVIVEGDDGIRRLFVAREDALAEEMRREGYAMLATIRWSVPSYNVGNENGEFVGLLATRPRRGT